MIYSQMQNRKNSYFDRCRTLSDVLTAMVSETYKFLSSSQTMGFLMVVAVSGSLAFLTFGKFRLWPSGSDRDACIDIGEKMQENAQQTEDSSIVPKHSSVVSRSGKQPKKVRFALDVVEPAGNGQEYRCRIKAAHKTSNKAYTEKQEEDKVCENGLYKSMSMGSETRTMCAQSLPTNRMLLYSGMQRYKALTALHVAGTW